MNDGKRRKNLLAVCYVIVLTLCVPLACFYIWLLSVFPIPYEQIAEQADTFGEGVLTILLFFLPVAVYWMTVLVLGILNIIRSFQICRAKDAAGCVNGMLIHKYGLVIFFGINFCVLALCYFVMTFGVLVGTRGLAIFAAPVLLPWLIAMMGFSVFAAWLALLPGAFYGIQVIRLSRKEKKISTGAAMWHGLLQFVFLADVLDAMYLAVRKWHRGRKSSVVIGILYILLAAGTVWLVIKMRTL
ncbi:hypothetical protein [Clostridium sp. Marseille-P3244]|uniref:hypothetical protein n=1 Tax=Clostridium sp. Marseille-P3244 TaxID=1871020 RepID=UPI00093201AA|nr:hypothetical protein [Clostridium sp. Marseille-P3244]